MKEKIRKGVSAVVFRARGKGPEFLILHRIKRWKGWELLKGGRRSREKPLDTLKRELMEEIGALNFEVIGKLPFTLEFKIEKKHIREMGFTHVRLPSYLVRYNGIIHLESNISKEHSGYKWVSFKKALKMLTFSTSKKELKVAHKYMRFKRII